MNLMTAVLGINIVAGFTLGLLMLRNPALVNRLLQNPMQNPDTPPANGLPMIGALWVAIGLMSLMGLAKSMLVVPVLVLQLMYKGIWLANSVFDLLFNQRSLALRTSLLFFLWMVLLAVAIPWQTLFAYS